MPNSTSDELLVETYKALFSLGPAAVRTCLLLNGGAVVALLAFIGSQHERIASWAFILSKPAYIYVVGAALCGVALFLGYVSQLRLFRERVDGRPRSALKKHDTYLYGAMGAVIGSIALFCWGSYEIIDAFQHVGQTKIGD